MKFVICTEFQVSIILKFIFWTKINVYFKKSVISIALDAV